MTDILETSWLNSYITTVIDTMDHVIGYFAVLFAYFAFPAAAILSLYLIGLLLFHPRYKVHRRKKLYIVGAIIMFILAAPFLLLVAITLLGH